MSGAAFDYIVSMPSQPPPLAWLEPGESFPPVDASWNAGSPAPGLLAAGGALDVDTLCRAYRQGIFPWFSQGQPVLWWSPDPRMVLKVDEFRLHPSFRKALRRFASTDGCEIRIDSAFESVISACSSSPRTGQDGTWIVPEMIAAYCALHQAGFAHSVETWVQGEMTGGLYCVGLGKAVFGESMFSRSSGASKLALAALVCFCRHHGVEQIDCQQNTAHLASLGAREMTRERFSAQLAAALTQAAPDWRFENLYWDELLRLQPKTK